MLSIAAPPWSIAQQVPPQRTIATRPQPDPAPLIRPLVYGREDFPPSDLVLSDEYRPKQLTVRALDDVILAPHHLIFTADGTALHPRTLFRTRMQWHGGIWLEADGTWTPREPFSTSVYTVSDEPLYYIDTDWTDMYGHLLIEVIPRLWALSDVDPDIRLASTNEMSTVFASMLVAAGVDPARHLRIERPTVVKELILPDAPVWKRHYAHPAAHEIYRGIVERTERDAGSPERIYVSRRLAGKRPMVNEAEVEDMFRRAGFAVIHPETMTFAEQVATFAGAKQIAGPGGSALHNAVFAADDAKVLIVCSAGWFVNADVILSQVPGRLGYVFGPRIGMTEDDPRGDGIDPWEVDLADVALGIREHFGITVRPRRSSRFRRR